MVSAAAVLVLVLALAALYVLLLMLRQLCPQSKHKSDKQRTTDRKGMGVARQDRGRRAREKSSGADARRPLCTVARSVDRKRSTRP